MKIINKILFILIIGLLFIPRVFASIDKNLVNIYLFYSDTCPHCAEEKKLLSELDDKYDNIEIYKYEISDKDNYNMLNDVAEILDTTVTGVPFTVIGEKVYKGFSYDTIKSVLNKLLNFFSFVTHPFQISINKCI